MRGRTRHGDGTEATADRAAACPPKRVVVTWVAGVGALLFLGYCVWALAFPHGRGTSGPVALDKAGGCPIPLPDTARRIQFFERSHWIEFVEFVRFEAPAEDCLAHVETVFAHWQEGLDTPSAQPDPLRAIETPPNRVHFAEEYGVRWFDLQNIQEGVTAGGGSGVPKIWVDTRRGVFYYMLTD